MKRKRCRTPSSRPSVRLPIGQVFGTVSVTSSDLCHLLRVFCQYASCLPEVRGHAVHHGEDPSSWDLPRPWFAQRRVTIAVLKPDVCGVCKRVFVSFLSFEGSRMIQVMLLKSLLQVNSVTLSPCVLTCSNPDRAHLIMLHSDTLSSPEPLNSAEILENSFWGEYFMNNPSEFLM